MKNKIKKVSVLLAGVLTVGVLGALIAYRPTETASAASNDIVTLSTIQASKAYAIVQGYDWGPAVPKVVLEFSENATDIEYDTFAVTFTSYGGMVRTNRTVIAAYNSDENGVKSGMSTNYVTVEMTVKSNESSPFVYNMQTGRNSWATSIDFTVTVNAGKSFTVGEKTYQGGDTFTYSAGAMDRKIPQTASWRKDTVHYTGEGKDITLQRAAWAPEGADTDSGKNPLVIWLHGAGEGGTDIDIDLLGNEVTALTTENDTNVQHYFKTSGLAGAYVLAVQTPTMWMDTNGNGNYNTTGEGKQESWYTEALWQAITSYVDGNPDIDTNRIYLGGCSNGGYMTMNMAFEHGDYFAAFYPICEAYQDSRISEDMIESIKDYNIWFLQAANDPTVNPSETTIATFFRLLEAGAENVHFTLTENVPAVDDPTAGTLNGHWAWVIAFNDEVKTEFDNDAIESKSDITFANCTKEGNLWSWLAAQTRDGSEVGSGGDNNKQPTKPSESLAAHWIALIVIGSIAVVGLAAWGTITVVHRRKSKK